MILMDPEIALNPFIELQWNRNVYRTGFLTHSLFCSQNFQPLAAPTHKSMYETTLDYFINHMRREECKIAEMDGFEALNPIFRLVSGEWHNICHIIESDLIKLSFQRETPHLHSITSKTN